MSEEHIVADWVLRAFLRTKKPRSDFSGTFLTHNEMRVAAGEPVSTAKVVCRPCNNEWLSAIDSGAASALKPLIQGRTEVVLTSDAQSAVAAWIFKCALTFDSLQTDEGGSLAIHREAFRRERIAPPGCTIYAGPAPPTPFSITGIPEVARVALFGVRQTPGRAGLTLNVKEGDGKTTTLPPTSIPVPGWTVMLGRMNAIISGVVAPIVPTPEWRFERIWPASPEPVVLTSDERDLPR